MSKKITDQEHVNAIYEGIDVLYKAVTRAKESGLDVEVMMADGDWPSGANVSRCNRIEPLWKDD